MAPSTDRSNFAAVHIEVELRIKSVVDAIQVGIQICTPSTASQRLKYLICRCLPGLVWPNSVPVDELAVIVVDLVRAVDVKPGGLSRRIASTVVTVCIERLGGDSQAPPCGNNWRRGH
jgi:hypothetical protein